MALLARIQSRYDLGLLMLGVIMILLFIEKNRISCKAQEGLLIFFAFSCMIAIIAVFLNFNLYGVVTQFAARANAALISFPLAVLVFILLRKPEWISFHITPHIKVVVTLFVVSVIILHSMGVYGWSKYLDIFDNLINNNYGVIMQDSLKKRLSNEEYSIFTKMRWAWTSPTMSILLSNGGQVKSMLLNDEGCSWQPFDPCDLPDELSQSDLFDIQIFQNYIQEHGCQGIK